MFAYIVTGIICLIVGAIFGLIIGACLRVAGKADEQTESLVKDGLISNSEDCKKGEQTHIIYGMSWCPEKMSLDNPTHRAFLVIHEDRLDLFLSNDTLERFQNEQQNRVSNLCICNSRLDQDFGDRLPNHRVKHFDVFWKDRIIDDFGYVKRKLATEPNRMPNEALIELKLEILDLSLNIPVKTHIVYIDENLKEKQRVWTCSNCGKDIFYEGRFYYHLKSCYSRCDINGEKVLGNTATPKPDSERRVDL